MAKLSLSVSGDNKDNEQGSSTQTSKLSLTKKVSQDSETDDSNSTTTASLSQKIEGQHTSSDPTVQSAGISSWLINTFGEETFDELIKNPNLKLPYMDENFSTEQWLERIVKTLFTQETISRISSKLGSAKPDDADVEAIVKERMDEKIEKYNARFQELRNQMENLEGEKAEISSKLNKALPLDKFVKEIFRDPGNETEPQKRIIQTLNEALEQSKDETVSTFVLRFSKGWLGLKSQIESLKENNEKENLEIIHSELTKLLTYISGCFISERRTILDLVAKYCNEYFSDYDFVSPEQTLNVDPEIHNASGIGNASIKEGSSFAVIRRDTKKTVKYADIKV